MMKEEKAMDLETVMKELEDLGKERTRKIYLSNGAHEPLFGVATGAMKPMARKIGINQSLAEELYATGNYDAMYFAGIIADPKAMTLSDYERWMDGAYFYMISDFIVSVTLSESDIAQEVSDGWIKSGEDLRMSAGYSCYCWLLGNRKDSEFQPEKISRMLDQMKDSIGDAPRNAKAAMSNFLYTVGISYMPMHEKALSIAEELGTLTLNPDKKKSSTVTPSENIRKEIERGRLGFKRRYVRC